MRREIRRVSPGCKVDVDDLRGLLQSEVLKRDVFDGDDAKQAAEFLKKAARSAERKRAKNAADDDVTPPTPSIDPTPPAPAS